MNKKDTPNQKECDHEFEDREVLLFGDETRMGKICKYCEAEMDKEGELIYD